MNGGNTLYLVPAIAITAFLMSFFTVYVMQKIPLVKQIVP